MTRWNTIVFALHSEKGGEGGGAKMDSIGVHVEEKENVSERASPTCKLHL